jgi:hypothetical protein
MDHTEDIIQLQEQLLSLAKRQIIFEKQVKQFAIATTQAIINLKNAVFTTTLTEDITFH